MKTLMMKTILMIGAMTLTISGCDTTGLSTSDNTTLMDVAQTSGQLASGSSFVISGSSSTTNSNANSTGTNTPGNGKGPNHGPHGGPQGRGGFLDGTSLLAPTDELLAIIDAESAGDFRGMRMHAMGGATVTNYDQTGSVVTLPPPAQNGGGPEGCSFSGKQFPKFDSLLAMVAKTVIDFGSGVTNARGNVSIIRSGKITITRSSNDAGRTETVAFENYVVNGASIEGIKTRLSTFDPANGLGSSNSAVSDGKITLSDGTICSWTSTKSRKSNITLNSNNRPASGQITIEGSTAVTATNGTIIYAHTITSPVIEDVSCAHRHAPVSGTVSTIYRTDTVLVDFGNGSCDNQSVTITLNGVASTKTLHP